MVGDCLQGQLSRHLLGESIPVGEINFVNLWSVSGQPKTKDKDEVCGCHQVLGT